MLSLDKLRHGINLRAYAQKDPLIEYKRDAFNLFEEMMLRIEEQVVSRVSHVQINLEEQQEGFLNLIARAPKQQTFETRRDPSTEIEQINEPQNKTSTVRLNVKAEERNPKDPSTWGNVGRNESCPCGSGKKYKQCHG